MDQRAGRNTYLIILLSLLMISPMASAIPARILTNTGSVAEGSISGIGGKIRLIDPGRAVLIGPATQFDVPASSIRQITVDFPRVVIEAEGQTMIGPFSAFSGIDEEIRLKGTDGGDLLIPISAIRAIALNGNPLHPAPRVWLGDRYLKMPNVISLGSTAEEGCASCTITSPSPSDETPIWNTIHPVIPPPDTGSEIPWWLGLLGVAGLVGVIYLISSGTD